MAATLWDGDDEQSIGKALALIKSCAEKLALRKSPLLDIKLGGTPQDRLSRRNSRFWKRFSLESVIEIAATVGHLGRPDDAVERAFSIIEKARTTLETGAKATNVQPRGDLVTRPGFLSDNPAQKRGPKAQSREDCLRLLLRLMDELSGLRERSYDQDFFSSQKLDKAAYRKKRQELTRFLQSVDAFIRTL